MLIFLPPSEGKSRPVHADAPPVNLASLALPELAAARTAVAEALIQVSGRHDAQKILKVGTKVMPEVAENRVLWAAPAAPAHQIYTGVLFDALGVGDLSPQGLERARERVLIFSGLFGVTAFSDSIPAYRLSMGVDLSAADSSNGHAPGRLGTFWKQALEKPLRERVGDQLVVDCRSSAYAAAFRPRPEQTLIVNNLTERDGRRMVVTHFAKHARGLLTGMLLGAERDAHTVDDVAEIASSRWDVEVHPASGRTAHQLNLIEHP